MNIYESFLKAKASEQKATAKRIAIEEDIIKLLGVKDEGSKTHNVGEGYKVVITGKVNRRIDVAVWDAIMHKIPENLRPVKYKPEVEIKGLRYLQANEADVYAIFAECLTASPGKTGVAVSKVAK